MQITRLVRILHILTLTRVAAFYVLRDVRNYWAAGQRAKGLRLLRDYRRLKLQLRDYGAEAARMLAAIIPAA